MKDSSFDNGPMATILVVDDEPIVRDVVVRYLRRYGCKTIEAASGDEAQRLLERDLLAFLASHPRRVFSREQLMDHVWGHRSELDTGTVTVHIRRLREKIEAEPARPRHIETVWGAGYRLTP